MSRFGSTHPRPEGKPAQLLVLEEKVRIRIATLLGIVLLFGMSASAQDFGKAEIGLDYSYVRWHANRSIVNPANLNGGGGSATVFFNPYIGLEADLQGYGSTTQHYATSQGNLAVSGNLFTYMGGVQLTDRWEHFSPFVHLLFGGAHSNAYGNLARAEGILGAARDSNGFAMAVGGGLDYRFGHFGVRLGDFDYLLTRLGNNIVGTSNQSSFRFQAGVLFNF